jgi:SpoVK/Ycf46/Vps4 family AAA+-type ATPase
MEMAEEGKSCVLLLEDAEPLLVSRGNSGRSDGITNLLNITDGLLNDMLSIQVIATFNTDLKNIDGALLRPERLIARKEFKRLNAQDANKLAKAINLDKTFTEDTSLAEIYSQQKAKEVLIHTYEDNKTRKLGF